MTRPAHQDIDRLTGTLGRRAEREGLTRGLALNARRQTTRWAIRWCLLTALAFAIGLIEAWLWWLPLAAIALAAVDYALLRLARARSARRIGGLR
jgi:hypothetical protein